MINEIQVTFPEFESKDTISCINIYKDIDASPEDIICDYIAGMTDDYFIKQRVLGTDADKA